MHWLQPNALQVEDSRFVPRFAGDLKPDPFIFVILSRHCMVSHHATYKTS